MVFYRRKSSVVHEQFGDETVIVNLDTGCYFSIDGTGDAIWAWVTGGLSHDEIVARVGMGYEGDQALIRAQTEGFLSRLVEEKLLEPTHEARDIAPPIVDSATRPWKPPALQKYTDMEQMLQLDPIHEVDEMGWPQTKKPSA